MEQVEGVFDLYKSSPRVYDLINQIRQIKPAQPTEETVEETAEETSI
jgi:hypothetical protein